MSEFKIAERFISINGEAARAGEPAVFIRFAGCNLECGYCDTKWANEADVTYETLSDEEIYDYIKRTGITNVTLTGGEPLVVENIDRLLLMLSLDEELNIEIETNGSVDIAEFKALTDRISYTLDYKLPDSGMEDQMYTGNYNYVDKNDSVKFVVSSLKDLDRAREIIYTYGLTEKTKVFISPVWSRINPGDIVDYMLEYSMNNVKLQLQLHKLIWGADERGV